MNFQDTLLISGLTILGNLLISLRTIYINRAIQKENVGKNRTIYGVEELEVYVGGQGWDNTLNNKLSSGNYAILFNWVSPKNRNIRVYTLGKIKP